MYIGRKDRFFAIITVDPHQPTHIAQYITVGTNVAIKEPEQRQDTLNFFIDKVISITETSVKVSRFLHDAKGAYFQSTTPTILDALTAEIILQGHSVANSIYLFRQSLIGWVNCQIFYLLI